MSAEQIKELTEKLEQCGHEDASVIANRVFNLGYCTKSSVVKEFAERLLETLSKYTSKHSQDAVPFYNADCEQIDDEIITLAEEYGAEVGD